MRTFRKCKFFESFLLCHYSDTAIIFSDAPSTLSRFFVTRKSKLKTVIANRPLSAIDYPDFSESSDEPM